MANTIDPVGMLCRNNYVLRRKIGEGFSRVAYEVVRAKGEPVRKDGEPRQLYFGADLNEPLVTPTGYRATPFANETNFYRGWLNFNGAEISSLLVEAFDKDPREPGHFPYVTVNMKVERNERPDGSPHFTEKYEAPMRFAAIAEAQGIPLKTLEHKAFAVAGKNVLDWKKKPVKN